MDVLTDKKYKSYDRLSRYSSFPTYYNRLDNKYMYGTTAFLNTETEYLVHTVEAGESLDSIALIYYNNPTFFWVIADFNRILDCTEDLQVGQKLYIPDISRIEFKY